MFVPLVYPGILALLDINKPSKSSHFVVRLLCSSVWSAAEDVWRLCFFRVKIKHLQSGRSLEEFASLRVVATSELNSRTPSAAENSEGWRSSVHCGLFV